MAKEKVDKKDKKEKKEKKRSETEGVHKSSKKDKKEKKVKVSEDELNAALEAKLQADAAEDVRQSKSSEDQTDNMEVEIDAEKVPVGALVPFAKPLADDKSAKKVLKSVKKAAKHKTLKRGVKEVVKALRKSPLAGASHAVMPGVVILAADISPMDVISHIPVLCEDHNVPYIFVTSRAELGAAGNTKRPTSVVMITETRTGKKAADADDEDAEEFKEVYKDLVKLVEKEGRQIKF